MKLLCRHYCRGYCDTGFKKPYYRNSPYISGYRYCRKCDRWFKTENKFCHCCGTSLRYRPVNKTRNNYYKVKRYWRFLKLLTKSQRERRRVRRRFEELKIKFGGKCFYCSQNFLLEFAHVKSTKLSGRGRGFVKRYYDIKNNPDCYKLTCKSHNYLAEL